MTKRKTIKKVTGKEVNRRTPKRLSHTLYSYVEPTNGLYARKFGKQKFGSFSNYVDVLIAADRAEHFSTKWWKANKPKNTKVISITRAKKGTTKTVQAA